MGEKTLTRKLGFWAALAIGVGSTVGSGIFVNCSTVAKAGGSPFLSILSWVVGGLVMIPQMMILAELSTAFPDNGYGYVLFSRAGSKPLAFLFGWATFWALDPTGIAVLALASVTYIAFFIPVLTGFFGNLLATVLIIVFAVLHYRSVKTGGAFTVMITIAKILPFALIIGLGLFFIHGGNFSNAAVATKIPFGSGLMAGVSATTWAYSGMAGICYMAGEFKNPGKTLPRALIGSAIVIMALYSFVSAAVHGLLPFDKIIATSTPITDALRTIPFFSSFAPAFVAFTAILVILGCLNTSIMFEPRMEFAMAQDNLFFKVFDHVHPKYETPDRSIALVVGFAIVQVWATNIQTLLGYTTLVLLIMNTLLYLTIITCRKRADYKPVFHCPAWPVMMVLSSAACAWMAWGTFQWAPIPGIIAAAAVVVTGLPAYYYWNSKKKKLENSETKEKVSV